MMLARTYTLKFICFGFILIVFSCTTKTPRENKTTAVAEKPKLFTLLFSSQTGIDFNNTLIEGPNTNILMYEYFYNGGGVAAGDMNGDGLTDLYFTSNMGKNKFYLNKGNMKFQDITTSSGVADREGPWKTGVTVADVNGDNKLDIYICYSGMVRDENRVNQLFINQGNDANGIPTFLEKAKEYGLASLAYSNQAYFFDYDRDGDLDALLLNHNPASLPILNEVSTRELLKKDDPLRGVRLFKQTKNHFDDVTIKSGINGSSLTYGLGVGITDFNNDGWSDIYVSNDYSVPDYLYINSHNGTFTNKLQESIGHTSQFSMGNDVGDINNDLQPEIITLDMLPEDNHRQKLLLTPDNYAKFDLNVRSGFHYQYMRNMLQLNNGNGSFSEIGQLAGISNTDWSWSALLADYDNDGWKDLLVTNGYYRDYTNLDFIKYMDDYVKSKGRLMREDVLPLISQMPASNVVNYIFANNKDLTFTNQTKGWGMDRVSNSNGAAYADLDNDGDLDIVINNINQTAFVYQNGADKLPESQHLQIKLQGEGMNTQGIGAKVAISAAGKKQCVEQMNTRGYLSAVSPLLHFGLGKDKVVDSVNVQWPGGKQQRLTNVKSNQVLTLFEKDAKTINTRTSKATSVSIFAEVASPINYQAPAVQVNDFKRQPLLINQFSFSGPCMNKGDVNGDGLEDVFLGGGNDKAAELFIQQKNHKFIRKSVPAFEQDNKRWDADAVFFDANNDGFNDLYVASGGYHGFDKEDSLLQDRLYMNDGKGNFTKSKSALPQMCSSKGCVVVNDINEDGYPDVFVGGRVIPGRYPETPASYLLINDGKGNFTNQIKSLAPQLEKIGMVTDGIWVDINQDKKNDLVVVGEWMPVSVFISNNGKLEDQTSRYFPETHNGFWNTIKAADFNKDGKVDLVAGNAGLNTQFTVSSKEPAEMYFKDFDNNGSVDPFFCFFIQGKSFPYVTRDEMLEQIGRLRSRFTTFKSYADISLQDVFKPEELSTAGHLVADRMETTCFLSSSTDDKFRASPLPLQSQFAPVYAIEILDFDKDGSEDLLLCGNNSSTKLRLGKSDANYGVLLKGNGKGGFQYVDQLQSGLKITGDVRSMISIDKYLLFGLCQQFLKAYSLKK
jgi:hypothetical protein